MDEEACKDSEDHLKTSQQPASGEGTEFRRLANADTAGIFASSCGTSSRGQGARSQNHVMHLISSAG